MRRLPRAAQLLPDGLAQLARCTGGGHPDQRHAADDERHHRHLQLRAGGQAGADHGPVRHGLGQQAGQHRATRVVQPTAEARRLHRAGGCQHLTRQDLARTQATQIVGLVGLATDRMHLEARAGKDVHGQRADPSGGPRHGQWPVGRGLPVVQHPHQGQCGSEAGRAQDHRLARGQSRRLPDHRAGGQAHIRAVAAIAGLAQPAAGGEHRITLAVGRIGRGDHRACHVDAADQRETPQDPALAGASQRIFIVDRGPVRADHHLARVELRQPDRFQPGVVAGIVLVDAEGVEPVGNCHEDA